MLRDEAGGDLGFWGGFFESCFYAGLPKTPVQSRSPQRVVISVTDSKISLTFSYLVPSAFLLSRKD